MKEHNEEEIKDLRKDTKEEKKELKEEIHQDQVEEKKDEKVKIQKEEKAEEQIDKMQQELLQKKLKNKKIKMRTCIITTIILALIILVSTVFALININNSNIMNGVYINGIDVSNLSHEEAKATLQKLVEDTTNKNIILKYNEYEKILVPKDVETKYDIDSVINRAYDVGRKGNIFQSNYEILRSFILKEKLEIEISINEQKLNQFIKDIELSIPDAVVQHSYTIDGENLIITKGTEGYTIKDEELKGKILGDLKSNLNGRDQIIELPVKKTQPDELNIEKIHEEIYKEPQNAYYIKEPFQLFTHVDGIDFDISIDEAKELVKEEKLEYTIPLKITPPEITTQKLGAEAFPELLSTFTTRFDASNTNRATNISIATKTINGTVLMPGETLSFNAALGPRTAAKGYKEAGAYLDGQVVESYGGGICQVSSTLYNTVLLANLEIVTRYNHSSLVSYLAPSRDAAVSYGGKDFVFKNSRTYPIKINASAKNGVLKIEMYGIKEEVEYEVVIESKVTQSIPYTIKYVDDKSLVKGTEVVQSKGTNGAKSVSYKVLKLNGAVISRTELSRDTYNPMQRIVKRGTKEVAAPVETVTPTETMTSVEVTQEPLQ